MAKINKFMTLMSAKGATGVSSTIPVKDFDSIVLAISAVAVEGVCTGTVKIQGAIGTTAPDFSSAQSVTNHRDYMQSVDLQNGANLPGDTGYVFAAADYRLVEINTSHLDFVCVELTWTAGAFTTTARANNVGF